MAAKRAPTLRAQWLGQQLRELREAAGLTLKDASGYLQRDASAVSRLEAGIYPAKVPEVLAYVNLCGVDSASQREELIQQAHDVWQKGWWDGYVGAVDQRFVDYPWLESRATRIRAYEAVLVTGLLQTRDYATALIENANGAATAEQIKQRIEFRMTRQQALDRKDPPRLKVVLDESALYRAIGGPKVMREQLTRLHELANRPSIELRVLPLRSPHEAIIDGSFTLFELPEPYPEVLYADTPAGAIYTEGPEAGRLGREYDRLWESTLGRDESAALIAAAAEELH